MNWNDLAEDVLAGRQIQRAEALAILSSPDDELLPLLDAAFRLRRNAHGRQIRVHVLQNAKSGICPENCSFCSQSARFNTGVKRYNTQSKAQLVQGARDAYAAGAATYCMVTSTRGPSTRDLKIMCEAVKQIKREMPLKICTSLGLLSPEAATQLKDAGVDRYNHNLESSERFFPEICSTHTWEDRHETLKIAKDAGMEACAGGIIGMGEEALDRVDLAISLRELGVESVPVNLLNPRPKTPFENIEKMRPQDALRALCMFRFVHPDKDVRISGGREEVLGHMQPFSFYPANSLFSQGYLTTGGQGKNADFEMMKQAGFEPVVVGLQPPEQERGIGI